MEIGVRIPHTGQQASPEFVREWCTTADQAGYDIVWGVDHVVMPQHTESEYILPRTPTAIADDAVSQLLAPNYEMMTTLAYVAGITERVKLGTAIAVLTIRNAVLNARQLATVDQYSGGRLIYGIGVGWLKEEAEAMNMPWDRRGARADEHIALLRAIWTEEGSHVEFHGEFWDIPPMDPEPRPVQRPIPIIVGGHTKPAMDRAARLGDGWIAAYMSPDRLAEHLVLLREACARQDRDPSELRIYCSGSKSTADADELLRYAEVGADCVQVDIDTLDNLKRFADEVLPRLR
ncbi:MAG TPA: TIGR03619 family F420-dependent LLM class oxidoreductase [Acidimicrobiales bacterium]